MGWKTNILKSALAHDYFELYTIFSPFFKIKK